MNGLSHGGNYTYRVECCGLVYFIFMTFILLRIDSIILDPVLDGDITKLVVQYANPDTISASNSISIMQPAMSVTRTQLSDFHDVTNLTITLQVNK